MSSQTQRLAKSSKVRKERKREMVKVIKLMTKSFRVSFSVADFQSACMHTFVRSGFQRLRKMPLFFLK